MEADLQQVVKVSLLTWNQEYAQIISSSKRGKQLVGSRYTYQVFIRAFEGNSC